MIYGEGGETMRSPSIRLLVKEEFGQVPHFCIYAVLEWVLIALMFVNGCVAFLATQLGKYCELRSPCLLCSRIDHVFAERDEDFHYNETMCEIHRRDVSYLAYCHNHKKLSDIRKMCEACLLSFATEKESDGDTYKSLVGILHKDLECFVEDQNHIHLSLGKATEDPRSNIMNKCCCCGLRLKLKNAAKVKNVHQLAEGLPKITRSNLDKVVFGSESTEGNMASESEESILHRLKRQVRLDCKSLMALYMELDEERNASAVAANNAMAMITRLQAEKAAVQMEALQYQRMMEEQAEYDQEALQETQKIIRDMENELEAYRHKFGYLQGSRIGKEVLVVPEVNYQTNITTTSSYNQRAAIQSSNHNGVITNESKYSQEGTEIVDEDTIQVAIDDNVHEPLRSSSSSSSSSSSDSDSNSKEETEKSNEVVITRESSVSVSVHNVESESEFLEDATERIDDGAQVLKEISKSEEDT